MTSDRFLREAEREYVSPVVSAMIEGLLGNTDAAFEGLELAYAERDPLWAVIKYWPAFGFLRGDPRWDELLRKIGLT